MIYKYKKHLSLFSIFCLSCSKFNELEKKMISEEEEILKEEEEILEEEYLINNSCEKDSKKNPLE